MDCFIVTVWLIILTFAVLSALPMRRILFNLRDVYTPPLPDTVRQAMERMYTFGLRHTNEHFIITKKTEVRQLTVYYI